MVQCSTWASVSAAQTCCSPEVSGSKDLCLAKCCWAADLGLQAKATQIIYTCSTEPERVCDQCLWAHLGMDKEGNLNWQEMLGKDEEKKEKHKLQICIKFSVCRWLLTIRWQKFYSLCRRERGEKYCNSSCVRSQYICEYNLHAVVQAAAGIVCSGPKSPCQLLLSEMNTHRMYNKLICTYVFV